MTKKKANRVYYRTSPDGVVVVKDGAELAVYRSTDELIETHIKGILAKERQDTKMVREVLRSYRPSDVISRRD
jgi:ribosomal protein L13